MKRKNKKPTRISCWVDPEISIAAHIMAYTDGIPLRLFVAKAIVAYVKWLKMADLKMCLESERDKKWEELEKVLILQRALIKRIHRKPRKPLKDPRYPGMLTQAWKKRIYNKQVADPEI